MIIENDGLSKEIYDFLCQDYYDHEGVVGKWSVTTLQKPPQQIILQRRHDEEIVLKASGMFFRVFGSAIHVALEGISADDVIQEKRFDAEVKLPIGKKGRTEIVTGKMDLIRLVDKEIVDYKTGSVWKWIFNDFKDYAEQLSVYRFLLHRNKIRMEKGRIVFIMRDFREGERGKMRTYPPLPIVDVPVNLKPVVEVERELVVKLSELILQARKPDDKLRPCTDEERWLDKKTGVNRRCRDYCSAVTFCHQAKALGILKQKELF